MRVTYGNTGLADPADALSDERLVPVMKRLISADKQRGWLLRVEHRAHHPSDDRGPALWCAVVSDSHIVACWGLKESVRVGEPPDLDAIGPDRERLAERRSRCLSRTDEIRNSRAAGLYHPVAQPPHAAR